MSEWIKMKNEFAAQFKHVQPHLVGNTLPWLQTMRQQAFECFLEQGFPKRSQENWKYTDISALEKKPLTIAAIDQTHLASELVANLTHLSIEKTYHLIFIDGCYIPQLSNIAALPQETLLIPLSQALLEQTDKIQTCFKAAESAAPLQHLNTALLTDGVFLYVPKNTKLMQPVRMLFLTTAKKSDVLVSPRNIIIAESNSECVLLEEHVGIDETHYVKNTFTQIFAAENAKLDYYKIQDEGSAAFHLSNTQVYQQTNSSVHSLSVSLGSRLARDDLDVTLDGKNAECLLNGLYLLSDQQHVDHHTRIDHKASHCNSIEHYKGILSDQSKGVFNGKVVVHPNAQKTSAQQNNQNLLLSKTAEINSKPELEIYADDVKCNHGATVGQISAESLFYLRARGIEKQKAMALLTLGFASEIVNRVKPTELFEYMQQKITGKINRLLECNELSETSL